MNPPMSNARPTLAGTRTGIGSQVKGTTPVSQNTIETDAKEFGLHVKQGGWRLGLLVARNVEKGNRGGDTTTIFQPKNGKVTGLAFANRSGTSAKRVLAHLAAWNRAADAGHVPHGDTLTPGQEVALDVETLPEWRTFYQGALTGDMGEDRRERLTNAAEAAGIGRGKVQEIANNPKAMAAAIKADPKTAEAARAALDEVYEAAPKPYADTLRRSPLDESLDLIEEFRRLHKGVDHIVQLVNDGRARITNPDAVLREIAWLRTALGYIEDGVKSDDLAAQVENFLAEVNR